jgi:hypothetical protein
MPAEFRNLTSQKRTVQISKSRFRNETNSPDFEESFSERNEQSRFRRVVFGTARILYWKVRLFVFELERFR